MNKIFNADNIFFRTMGKAFDLVLLNILWIICCLGVITIAPATTAMYYAVAKSIRRDRGYVTKEFFHSFISNIKQGLLVSVVFIAIGLLLSVDFNWSYDIYKSGSAVGTTLIGVFAVISLIAIGTFIYTCAVLSRFEYKFGPLLRVSFRFACRHMGETIIIALIIVALALGCYVVYPGVFLFPSLAMLLISFMMERILKKYTPVPELSEEESGKDYWYLE